MQISHCTQSITNCENTQISEMRHTWEMFWYQQSYKKYKLVLHRTSALNRFLSELQGQVKLRLRLYLFKEKKNHME